jgi:hypothetical protein
MNLHRSAPFVPLVDLPFPGRWMHKPAFHGFAANVRFSLNPASGRSLRLLFIGVYYAFSKIETQQSEESLSFDHVVPERIVVDYEHLSLRHCRRSRYVLNYLFYQRFSKRVRQKEDVFVVLNRVFDSISLDNANIGLYVSLTSIPSKVVARYPTKFLGELDSRNTLEAIVGSQQQHPSFAATEIDESASRGQIQGG